MMDQSIVFLFAGLILVAALMIVAINRTKNGSKHLDVEHYRAKCLEIEHQLKADEPSSYHLCVINADKLLDRALRGKGFKGKTIGERMRSAAKKFSDRNSIWNAHKLRNQIAHEYDAEVTYQEARYALAAYRKALKDLGAI